jgi:hypothetical protein
MKPLLPLILILLLNNSLLFSQSRKSIRVKAGEDIAQAYSSQGFYRFPQFGKATFYFKGGGKNAGQLFNYNILSGTMQFVGSKMDTLDMAIQAPIDSVVFDNTTFHYHKDGFMEVVAQTDSIALLKRTTIKTQVENIGAYGISNQTGSIDNLRNFAFGSSVYSFRINQDVVLSENISWFLKDRNDNLVKATKSNLLKLLSPVKQNKAEAYIKQTKISFDKEEDLKQLFAEISK